MIGRAARFYWLRWMLAFLLSPLWTAMGRTAALAGRGDFGHGALAAKNADEFVNLASRS